LLVKDYLFEALHLVGDKVPKDDVRLTAVVGHVTRIRNQNRIRESLNEIRLLVVVVLFRDKVKNKKVSATTIQLPFGVKGNSCKYCLAYREAAYCDHN
jgi:hypothetical protein